jgi:hypothetical protein
VGAHFVCHERKRTTLRPAEPRAFETGVESHEPEALEGVDRT